MSEKINQHNSKGKAIRSLDDLLGNDPELPNGQLLYEVNYVNGKQNGYWKAYYSNGKSMEEGNYINGEKNGYWKTY